MEKTVQLLVKLPSELRSSFQSYAQRHARSASELVRHLIEEEMRTARMISMLTPHAAKEQYNFPPQAANGRGKNHVADDQGKIYRVHISTIGSLPVLRFLDPQIENGFFDLSPARGASALIDRIFAVMDSGYSWDTPAYRGLCSELELDPDRGRPEYKEADKPLMSELEHHVAWSASGGDYGRLNQLIFDLRDLLRTDRRPEFYTYKRSAETLRNWTFKLPKAPFSDAFSRIDLHRIGSSKSVHTSIDFLPSWKGRGYSASINLWSTSNCEDDGWEPQSYEHVTGVALEPAHLDLAMETVVRRLTAQGVVFLSASEARAYMDGEGAYWAFRQGSWQCPGGLQPPTLTASERMLWRLRRPATPLYDQHATRKQL